MSSPGITVKGDSEGKRIKLGCEHQNGIVYVVSSEASWVCTDELRHVHSLAGFFKDISGLKDPGVRDVMQKWGLYYREIPLEDIT